MGSWQSGLAKCALSIPPVKLLCRHLPKTADWSPWSCPSLPALYKFPELATCLLSSPSPHQTPPPQHWGSHDASRTLGLAPATGLVVGLDKRLHSILKDTAHCPSHHVGTPVPAGTTPPRPKSQRHTARRRAQGLPEGLRESQRRKGPWGPVGAGLRQGWLPHAFLCGRHR